MVASNAFNICLTSFKYNCIIILQETNHLICVILRLRKKGSIDRTSCKTFHKFVRKKWLSGEITSKYLSPCFLNNENPYFVADGLSEQRRIRRLIAGNKIINNDVSKFAMNIESKNIKPNLSIVEYKGLSDSLRMMSSVASEGGQTVRCVKFSLLYVPNIYALEQSIIRFQELRRS